MIWSGDGGDTILSDCELEFGLFVSLYTFLAVQLHPSIRSALFCSCMLCCMDIEFAIHRHKTGARPLIRAVAVGQSDAKSQIISLAGSR